MIFNIAIGIFVYVILGCMSILAILGTVSIVLEFNQYVRTQRKNKNAK